MEEKVYTLTGNVLKLIQYWEEELKKLTIRKGIEKSDDKRSLSNMNSFLFRNGYIDENIYLSNKKVIEIRNVVIHRLFLDYSDFEYIYKYLLSCKDIVDESLIMIKSI